MVEHNLAKVGVASSNLVSRSMRPIRLVVQDTALSRREQGFEPPMGRHFPVQFAMRLRE